VFLLTRCGFSRAAKRDRRAISKFHKKKEYILPLNLCNNGSFKQQVHGR
jgi:hypothetical protein